MTALVVDASVAAAWILPDEHSESAEALKIDIAERSMLVPTLWWAETRNLLLMAERRDRINEALTTKALTQLARLPVVFDGEPEEGALLSLSRSHQFSVYDALYLELARRKGAALATLDKRLAAACRAERVELAL